MKSEDEKKSLAGAADEQPAAETNGESAKEKPVAPEAVEGEAGACADGAEQPAAEAEQPATDAPEEGAEEDFFSEEQPPARKKRLRRKDMTPEQKRRRTIRDLIITGTVFGVVLLFFAICALCSWVGYSGNFDYIATVEAVEYDSPFTLVDAEESETGYYEFVAQAEGAEFRVLQLTDVHIGAGAFSAQKDRWALEAVSYLVNSVKPDLVIVTGDIAYPVPFQAGTFNNKREAEMFATLMEQLGVYWTITFGNHDTEVYSLYDREEIATEVYMDEKWEHCLFRFGPEDIGGAGNDIIIVKDADNSMSQALVTIDSHSYTDGDYFGMAWKYDNIHQSQIEWYALEMDRLANEFNGGEYVKNLVFFHIPLTEYGKYWNEYKDNGHENTDNVTYVYGKAGESGEKSYPGVSDCQMFETMLTHGGQGTFCGHDHYNNFAIDVTATVEGEGGTEVTGKIRLTYGMSIDYLAYVGIAKEIEQRGGTEIKISADGSFATRQRPYQDATPEDDKWHAFA